ncbi:hypothetical protein PAXRUDRAFT_833941 [Paxillus rubicundulus Ve08.2h10]|uniref:Uncharacterized protein n=1 Tax=Paxillus rubicundulus Ve08.2h10 TaxID=930991 RepID=A0A0D0DMP1_9AGAM|nr:hypothetical protein PAXRUDRAFT_833941 [Paxillus rubicundulus Ve08.2h10]
MGEFHLFLPRHLIFQTVSSRSRSLAISAGGKATCNYDNMHDIVMRHTAAMCTGNKLYF